MSTDEAFAGLVASKYLWRVTGESENLRRWYRYQLKHQRPILIDTQLRLLAAAGFESVPAQWILPDR